MLLAKVLVIVLEEDPVLHLFGQCGLLCQCQQLMLGHVLRVSTDIQCHRSMACGMLHHLQGRCLAILATWSHGMHST